MISETLTFQCMQMKAGLKSKSAYICTGKKAAYVSNSLSCNGCRFNLYTSTILCKQLFEPVLLYTVLEASYDILQDAI